MYIHAQYIYVHANVFPLEFIVLYYDMYISHYICTHAVLFTSLLVYIEIYLHALVILIRDAMM